MQLIHLQLQSSRVSIEAILNQYECPPNSQNTSSPTNWDYAVGIFCVLALIDGELEKVDEFPLPIVEAKKIPVGLRRAIDYGIKPYIGEALTETVARSHLTFSTSVLLKIVANKHFPIFCSKPEQKVLHRDILSGLFCILAAGDSSQIGKFEEALCKLTAKLPHSQYFEILFLIKGDGQLPQEMQRIVHKQLLQCLYRSGSFTALCEALLPDATAEDEQNDEMAKKRWHGCSVISTILGRRGYSKQFYHMTIDEIHKHLLQYINCDRTNQHFYADVAVQVLSRLCSLQLNFIRSHIVVVIFGQLEKLVVPDVLIAGAIVFDEMEMVVAIRLIYLAFCATGPSDVTLPSELLVPYLPVLFQLHNIFNGLTCPSGATLKQEITAVIVRCLANRETSELNKIAESILYENYDDKVKCLHPRIHFAGDAERFYVKISSLAQEDDDGLGGMASFHRSSVTLVNLLKMSDNNVLIYNVFLHLLQMFSDNFAAKSTMTGASAELMDDVDELTAAIECNFKRKYAVINALNELILFKPFHSQFSEHPHDIIAILDKILIRQIECIESTHAKRPENVETDCEEFLIVVLSIVGDFLRKIRNEDLTNRLHRTLRRLQTLIQGNGMSAVVAKKLSAILEPQVDATRSEYALAHSLLTEPQGEPYTKVYGIMSLLKLINAKDDEALLNAHSILALAMKMLREDDSYIFLNCIKLLIGLVEILQDTVIEALVAEYHLDVDTEAADIDFKLKIGETIVKITQGLGEMCYNYKDTLISCFLRGSCHTHAEFRTSNISNLGMVLRALSYQIHNFFQEVSGLLQHQHLNLNHCFMIHLQMITVIRHTLEHDEYVPARRASAMVLSDVLRGMNSLTDHEDFLLPMYRLLKEIAENDSDLNVQIHARNGLEHLKDKVKDTFNARPKIEKEIKILGVNPQENVIRFK